MKAMNDNTDGQPLKTLNLVRERVRTMAVRTGLRTGPGLAPSNPDTGGSGPFPTA